MPEGRLLRCLYDSVQLGDVAPFAVERHPQGVPGVNVCDSGQNLVRIVVMEDLC